VGAEAGTGSTEEEGAASTELPSSSARDKRSGVYWGEGQETPGGEAGIAGVDEEGSSDVSTL
jgi:hypothetical protein